MDDENTFTMELEMIILLNRRGKYAEATALARPLLEKAERLFGHEAPRTARALFELATALVGDEQHGEAEPLFRRVLLADEKGFGPNHPELITDLDWLGGAQHELGLYEEAEKAYHRAIQIGSSYPDRYMAAPFSNYSLLLLDMGKLEEAEATRCRVTVSIPTPGNQTSSNMKYLSTICIGLITAFLLTALRAAPVENPNVKKAASTTLPDMTNVAYGSDQKFNVIDLWKAKSDKPTPLVIFIHGGGFGGGAKDQILTQFPLDEMLKAGGSGGVSL